jgi:hypothetical protein
LPQPNKKVQHKDESARGVLRHRAADIQLPGQFFTDATAVRINFRLTGGKTLGQQNVESALDEMLFSGGTLNEKLLGFSRMH